MIILQRWYRGGVPTGWHLLGEGTAVAVGGTLFAVWLFPAEVSLISVFLAAISTTDSIERILDWNRRLIFEERVAPRTANARLVLLVLPLFLGTMLGFSIFGLTLPFEDLGKLFSHQVAEYQNQRFTSMQFGSVGALVGKNLYVLLFFFAIAVPFRQGGVMLAVAWNASVWGATFGYLARDWASNGGPGLMSAYFRVIGACFPHMAMEAAAYVLAGFAGVFMSKGLLKYSLDSMPILSITRSVCAMLAMGLGLVVVGALWEANVAPYMVGFLSKSP